MSKKLYLDGCSYTYGLGIDEQYKLRSLFKSAGYEVVDNSRPGKSNLAICLDTYNNIKDNDVIVLGFTYSSRYYLRYDNFNIDLSNTRYEIDNFRDIRSLELESAYRDLHKSFYTLFDQSYWNNVSDMLIDNTLDALKIKNKIFFAFSWESRDTDNKLFYPVMDKKYRLDDGHLNINGTQRLFDQIQQHLGDM